MNELQQNLHSTPYDMSFESWQLNSVIFMVVR